MSTDHGCISYSPLVLQTDITNSYYGYSQQLKVRDVIYNLEWIKNVKAIK